MALHGTGARAQSVCPPSTLTVARAPSDGPWREALDAMRATLTGSDRPWHCTGARVQVSFEADGGAALDVALPSGTALRRHITRPVELTPTLQATLILDTLPALELPAPAMPTTAGREPVRATPETVAREGSAVPATATVTPHAAHHDDAAIEGALDVGMRLGATPSYTSLALRARVTFRVRAWSLFAWARVEPWTHRLVDRGPGRYLLDVGVLGVGASWGRPLAAGRVEVGPTVSTNSYVWRDQALLPGQRETYVQVRLGALARWTYGVKVGLTVTADVDVAPVSMLADTALADVPSPPVWSAGLAVGVAYGGPL